MEDITPMMQSVVKVEPQIEDDADFKSWQNKDLLVSNVKEEVKSEYESEDEEIKPPATVFVAPNFKTEDNVNQETGRLSVEVEDISVKRENESQSDSGVTNVCVLSADDSPSGEKGFSNTKSDHSGGNAEVWAYECGICRKRYLKKCNFVIHIEKHSREIEFQCGICQKNFKTDSLLKKHMTWHFAERVHKCDICQKIFKTISCLKRHMTSHSDERLHKCDVCQKGFKTKLHLNEHMTSHSNERPYQCDICQKSLKTISNLKKHKKVHSEERP